jgi:hypothetical protein
MDTVQQYKTKARKHTGNLSPHKHLCHEINICIKILTLGINWHTNIKTIYIKENAYIIKKIILKVKCI